MNNKTILLLICLSGLSAVALGAFGAHGLKPYLSEHQQMIYEKGISYQFYHTLAALLAYILYEIKEVRALLTVAALFLIGIICFSGSLYLLATVNLTSFPEKIVGPITPIGGLFFIAGWGLMMYAAVKNPPLSDK